MSGAGQLALLLVVVNLVACLIAERAMIVSAHNERDRRPSPAAASIGAEPALEPDLGPRRSIAVIELLRKDIAGRGR